MSIDRFLNLTGGGGRSPTSAHCPWTGRKSVLHGPVRQRSVSVEDGHARSAGAAGQRLQLRAAGPALVQQPQRGLHPRLRPSLQRHQQILPLRLAGQHTLPDGQHGQHGDARAALRRLRAADRDVRDGAVSRHRPAVCGGVWLPDGVQQRGCGAGAGAGGSAAALL
jgi:hypothetical protein